MPGVGDDREPAGDCRSSEIPGAEAPDPDPSLAHQWVCLWGLVLRGLGPSGLCWPLKEFTQLDLSPTLPGEQSTL